MASPGLLNIMEHFTLTFPRCLVKATGEIYQTTSVWPDRVRVLVPVEGNQSVLREYRAEEIEPIWSAT